MYDARIAKSYAIGACSIPVVTNNTAITGYSQPINAHSVAFSASSKMFITNNNKISSKNDK